MTLSGQWTLDPTHSEAGFTVRHAGISKVRGKFTELEAKASHDGEQAAVTATIQAASFTTGNEDRDAHIKSADFLHVEEFPTLTFAGLFDGEELSGTIEIHGVSQPITFQVEQGGIAQDPFGNTRLGMEATTTLSRKDFGLTWNAPLELGGVLVGDKVTVELDLSFIKE